MASRAAETRHAAESVYVGPLLAQDTTKTWSDGCRMSGNVKINPVDKSLLTSRATTSVYILWPEFTIIFGLSPVWYNSRASLFFSQRSFAGGPYCCCCCCCLVFKKTVVIFEAHSPHSSMLVSTRSQHPNGNRAPAGARRRR